MRIFVTGASGWIGSAVVPELSPPGMRSSGSPALMPRPKPSPPGCHPHRGTIDDLDGLRDRR